MPSIFPSAFPSIDTDLRVPPPPPKETIASTVGFVNIAMDIATRGGLDEISTSRISNLQCKDSSLSPAPADAETETILKTHWPNILNHSKHLSQNKVLSHNTRMPAKGERTLGKRGRLYNDIWNEEDFLDKYKTYSLSTCTDWSDIFKNYHDDHDGCYIEWFLHQLHQRKQVSSNQHSLRQLNHDSSLLSRKISTNISEYLGISLVPPPVPVSIQHPASWGPGNRISNPPLLSDQSNLSISPIIHHPPENRMREKLRSKSSTPNTNSPRPSKINDPNSRKIVTPEFGKNHMINVHRIHPACVSNTILNPPGFRPDTSIANDTLKRIPEYDSIDEIGLHAEYLSKLLKSVSARNFSYLSHMMTSMERESELSHLRQTKQRLLSSCHAISKILTEARSKSVQQSLLHTMQHAQNPELTPHTALTSMLRLSTQKRPSSSSSEPSPLMSTLSIPLSPSPSPPSHPCQRLSVTLPIYPNSFGSVTTKHLHYFSFLQSIKLGSKIEVKLQNLSHIWSACYVSDLKFDEAGVLRFIEV